MAVDRKGWVAVTMDREEGERERQRDRQTEQRELGPPLAAPRPLFFIKASLAGVVCGEGGGRE